MKKTLKIIGISLLIIIAILIAIPFAFESQIEEAVKRYINKNLNAQVDFADVSLSLINSFPKAKVSIDELAIVNNAPFKGETLVTAKSIALKMPIKALFNNESESITINTITVNEALLTLKTDAYGNNNFDIVKKDTLTKVSRNTNNNFSFDIENYSINNSAFNFLDASSAIKVSVTNLNHSGNGNFSNEVSELDTSSKAKVSLQIDSTTYLNNNNIKLDAIIDLDLENKIYSFKENKGFINNLPLEFSGFVKQLEKGQDIDINFINPSSSFKDFLAVIPSEVSKNIKDVNTTGNFKVDGRIKGISNAERIPNITINIDSDNASFKYPDLPKSVDNINIHASIKNDSGNSDDTYITINNLDFKIDEDSFKGNAIIKNITKNIVVNANIDGVLNLANISKAYPVELQNDLQGILKGKLNTAFDMDAIDTNAYHRIKNNGNVTISDFIFSSEDIVNPINISEANIDFKQGNVTLNSFNAITGSSDLEATGTINNFLGFLLSDKNLQGNFNVNSNKFRVADFMIEDESTFSNSETKKGESLKIPSFLDANINANAKTVIYDNLTLRDVKGNLIIKNETATLNNVTSNLFNGKIALKGDVNTIKDIPVFNMNLGIEGFDISESFNNLELLQTLAPVAKILQGKLNTSINLSGRLTKDFTPNISSVSGDAFAEVITSSIETINSELLNNISSKLNFIDFSELDLKDLKTKLSFKDGNVNVEPFNINYKDISITIDGSHGFDKSLDYNAVFNVPASYLGSDVNRLIGQINDPEVNTISIPITATITGSYLSPKVNTDLTSGISNLTKQLVEIQKKKLIDKGKDELKDVIGDVLGKDKDTTNTNNNPVEDGLNDILDGVLGGNKKENDSTKTDTADVKNDNPIDNVLGNIFKKKKKKKDSVN